MGQGLGSRGESWGLGAVASCPQSPCQAYSCHSPSPTTCVHEPPTPPTVYFRGLRAGGEVWAVGRGSLVGRWSPAGTVGTLKDHRARPPYVPDEIEGQREKIHLFNLSSAGPFFPLSNKDSPNACQIQEAQQRGPLLSVGFCSDEEGDTINLELEAALPRLVGGHRAEPGPSAVPFPGPVRDDCLPSLEPELQFSLKSRWKHLEGLKLDFSLDTSEQQRVLEVHITFDQLRQDSFRYFGKMYRT